MFIESYQEVYDAVSMFEEKMNKMTKNRQLKISVDVHTNSAGEYKAILEVVNWEYTPLYHDGQRNYEREDDDVYPFGVNRVEFMPQNRLVDAFEAILEEVEYIVNVYDALNAKKFEYKKVFTL